MNKTPLITVYGTENGEIINKFRSLGFEPIVDSLHGGNIEWLENNYVGPKRFYVGSDGMWSVLHYPVENPTFSISFNYDVEMSDEDWEDIWRWVGCKIFMTYL